jgi:tetratricopeptide (TPR) repeat protein
MLGLAFETVAGLAKVVLTITLVVGCILWSLRKADEPSRVLLNWALSAPVLAFMVFYIGPMLGRGDPIGAVSGVLLTAVSGLVLAIIWGSTLCSWFARPLTALFDGGDEAPVPQAAYSIAWARRKQGAYAEAVAEVQRQLDRFPNDVEGQLLLAEIQAENLHDLAAAETTILRFCAQPSHAPSNIMFALYSMADWHLKYDRDAVAAQRCLEKVIELLPDSEFSEGAAQRIGHLGTAEMLLDPEARRKMVAPTGVHYPGLAGAAVWAKAPGQLPADEAVELVKHLEVHPLDTEAREHLAVIYADHYQRLELAAEQLEELIQHPHQSGKRVVHWLNLLADLQMRNGADYPTVRQTLQRIIDRAPDIAAAELARKRIELLKLEFKAKESVAVVKLGVYEQNLGLKGRLPHNFMSD